MVNGAFQSFANEVKDGFYSAQNNFVASPSAFV